MAATTTVLITGGNRGIGKGLVTTYLSTPNSTVIVTVRDLNHPTTQVLRDLPKAAGSSLIVLELELSSTQSITDGIASLPSKHGIKDLDIVIANAAIAGMSDRLSSLPVAELEKHVNVNVYGNFELFKATVPLLRASPSKRGKFVLISSTGGSLNTMNLTIPVAAYGASKAFANFVFKWLALENDDLIIWAQNPGFVATEKVSASLEDIKKLGIDIDNMVISVEESAKCIKSLVDGATAEKNHGKFLGHDGVEVPW